jgi:putative lipoprotein (rSAM/lipoprotein system)
MKILNRIKCILAGLISTGATLAIAACYGVTDEHHYNPSGNVFDAQSGKTIQNIEVCAVQNSFSQCVVTDSNGYFEIIADPNLHYDSYELCATDVDSEENGYYDSQCVQVNPEEEHINITFMLQPDEK